MKTSFALLATLLAASPVFAESNTFESDETPAALVELYTSEGCSSCPPADAWLSKLKTSPDLWKKFVPVAFHVDYWNYLGWADRFSSHENTARQQHYAAAWRSESVYTPGFVLNGLEWRGWSGHETVPAQGATPVGKLVVRLQEKSALVVFSPIGAGSQAREVEVALLGGNLDSDVKRGENGGRKLHHDFTVLQHFTAPLHADHGRLIATLPAPAKSADPVVALAAWVTPGNALPPIQAAGGWLAKP